jgi:N-dimethylarginine dimethylaminohydrolase
MTESKHKGRTVQSEVRPLRRVLLRHARDAFESPGRIAREWRRLNYLDAPDYEIACREYDAFAALLESLGVQVHWAPAPPPGAGLSMDAVYVRDAALISDGGAILCSMGKGARAGEPEAMAPLLSAAGLGVRARIATPATLEGGDVAWLDEETLAVGRGYRTSQSGIDQLAALLTEVRVVPVPLPHWKGPDDVFHLMSMLSPLAPDLLLVYSPLLPVPFREDLIARGFQLVEVPDREFESQGCNVLAVAPRVAVALEGNPETRRRMEAAGVEVHSYTGTEISLKGCGGPTCLTRPLERD